MLIAEPFDQQRSIPGAEQGTGYPDPVYVTGWWSPGGDGGHEAGPEEPYGPAMLGRDTFTVQHEWSDPRLQGTETWVRNCIDYEDDSELTICHHILNIVTDEGAWRMRPVFEVDGMDPSGSGATVNNSQLHAAGTRVLDGEGEYASLSVVLATKGLGFEGFIVPTDVVPPVPEGASTK